MFSDSAIAIQPVFAQWVQHVHVGIFGGALPSPVWSHTVFTSADSNVGLMPVVLGTADFMVHHIHAFTIHVTALILLKGVLFARGSRLIPDKSVLAFRFPCDGPGRGGTCQVSAWDHVFLGLFWMYNSISVVIFSLQLEDAIGRVGRLAVGFERESHYGRKFRPKCQHN